MGASLTSTKQVARVQGFTLSVAQLLNKPGERKDISIAKPLTGIGTALARLPEGRPIKARLRLESVIEGILVTGSVEAATTLECARCLQFFDSSLSLQVCELYVAPGNERLPDEDSYRVTGGEIHLETMLRDVLTLALPLNPLCDPACKGLCPRCGTDLNGRSCSCPQDDVDPRWAPLADLRLKLAGDG
jgi:uncharacterized protein